MNNPRMTQWSAIGIAVSGIVAALGYAAIAADSTRDEKIPAAVDPAQYADFVENEVFDIQDLAEGAEIQRRIFNLITPPGIAWLQPMSPPVAPFAAANFDDSFLDDLLGEDKNSVAVYPLSLALDPKTRETLIYNADGKLIATLPADKTSRAWPEDADPARVTLQLDLLPSEDVEPYLYAESRITESTVSGVAKSAKPPKTGGFAMRSLGAGQFGVADIQQLTNGNMRVTVTNGEDVAETFAYTVWHTSSVVVVTYTNEESNVVTDTNTVWTPVSPPLNGLQNAWECQTTNLVLANGVGVWEDANISSNARIRFYAVANRTDTDEDGLTDGAELFVHHTDPVAADTDGDELSDGEELNDCGTNPLAVDTDGDGLSDGDEVNGHGTDPLDADTDGDGMPDGWEVLHLFNPLSGPSARLDWFRFDEGTGVAVRTTSGSFTGVLLNAATTNWIRGHTGGSNDFALWFDGTDDYVSVPTNESRGTVVTQAPFSVSAWVFQATAPPGQYATAFSDSSWVSNHFAGYLFRRAGASSHSFYVGGATNHGSCYGSVASSRWVHLVGVYNGTNMQLYVDGALSAAGLCKPFQPVKGGLWIGRGHVNAGESCWKGAIDDVRFYNCAMGTQEVASLYEPFADADSDGLSNLAECHAGTNPRNVDTDGDGLGDDDEVNGYGTDPLVSDTDGDGLFDGDEVNGHGTDPLDADTDGDEMPDGWEVANSLDPLEDDGALDGDDDKLSNQQEFLFETDPHAADTDQDGLPDGEEVFAGLAPTYNPLLHRQTTWRFIYDEQNRLTAMDSTVVGVSMAYDDAANLVSISCVEEE